MCNSKSRDSDFLRWVITDNYIGINGILLYNTYFMEANVP